MKRKQVVKSTPPIYSFFSNTKSVSHGSASDFYVQNLPKNLEKSSEIEQSKNIESEHEQLKKEVERLRAENVKLRKENEKTRSDFAKLLKVHNETCRMYVNKEIKVKLLEKKNFSQGGVLYETFKHDFGDGTLKQLRKLSGTQRSDSTFILKCMRKLFENSHELQSMTACGTDGNSSMPKQKREILESIFLERLKSENLSDSDVNVRYLRLTRLINVAICNIKKKKVSQFVHYRNNK